MTAITVADLTQTTINGSGVFDQLMRAAKAHLELEFQANRITGTSYADVYLGQLQSAMSNALTFLVQRDKIGLEADLLAQQILLAQAQVAKATAELAQVEAQTELIQQQKANAVLEADVLVAQKCLLQAQFDNTAQTTLKTTEETALLAQKVITERAQTQALGVDANSVIGKQIGLYQAQTDGFKRDAEQKAVKIWVDSWSVRRTTDDATVADGTNKLDDATGGRLMTKMLDGIGA